MIRFRNPQNFCTHIENTKSTKFSVLGYDGINSDLFDYLLTLFSLIAFNLIKICYLKCRKYILFEMTKEFILDLVFYAALLNKLNWFQMMNDSIVELWRGLVWLKNFGNIFECLTDFNFFWGGVSKIFFQSYCTQI